MAIFWRINITCLLSTFCGKLSGLHKNIFSANLHSVAIHTDRGVLPDLAGGHVVLPSMPRAGHDLPVHDTLTERSAPVEAGIVDGIELATDIGQRNGFALNLKRPDRSRRDFIGLCCSRKRHRFLLSPGSVSVPIASDATGFDFYFAIPFLNFAFYRGSGVCATITPFLNSSTIWGFKRTSVGRFASVIWSILSCSFNSAKKRPSGRGGHPTTYTSTGTIRSTPCKTEYALNGPPTLEHAPMEIHHLGSGICSHTRFSTGAIFTVTVPPTLISSPCPRYGRNPSHPNPPTSTREVVEPIISMAQHARANVRG